MGKRSLYRYFDEQRWADEFLSGNLRFSTLAYFQNMEHGGVRADANEGVSPFAPAGGLAINNLTQGVEFTLTDHVFEAAVRNNDVFAYCLSRSFIKELWRDFEAVVCVEILDVGEFCRRVLAALPNDVKLPDLVGQRRLGHRVTYYDSSDSPTPRWALPGMIAISKRRFFVRQDEFRLVFSRTSALEFQQVDLRITPNGNNVLTPPTENCHFHVSVGKLDDICHLRRAADLPTAPSATPPTIPHPSAAARPG